jgi:Predicted Fe-S protein
MVMLSPCQKICRLNEGRTHCMACKRSLAEIAGWAKLDQEARDKIVAELPTRSLNIKASD